MTLVALVERFWQDSWLDLVVWIEASTETATVTTAGRTTEGGYASRFSAIFLRFFQRRFFGIYFTKTCFLRIFFLGRGFLEVLKGGVSWAFSSDGTFSRDGDSCDFSRGTSFFKLFQ